MRRKLIVGNWKMNGSLAMNAELLSGIREGLAGIDCDLAICVPFPYLPQCQAALEGTDVALGAQDVSAHAVGAYTGQISTRMLLDFGCKYVIVGHRNGANTAMSLMNWLPTRFSGPWLVA